MVLDTNVVVSAFIAPAGNPGRIREAWQRAEFEVVVSGPVLSEYRKALTYPKVAVRHLKTPGEIDRDIESLAKISIFVKEWQPLRVVEEDPNDDKFLECAIAGEAEVIVSGDSHLLKLRTFQGIQILAPAEFLALLTQGN